ncbi:MAG: hypothetical protein JXA71_10890 [Chitinispirillaceae bacterium]|nr:hypothetical protein [Chitinispirillaceae bacterium]
MLSAVLGIFTLYVFITSDKKNLSAVLFLTIAAAAISVLFITEPFSIQWKYNRQVEYVKSGYEGEIAGSGGEDTALILLNNSLYRAKIPSSAIEQSVHLPAAMHGNTVRRVLVLGNTGQVRELEKYPGVYLECFETEPLLSDEICRYGVAEDLQGSTQFDIVLLSSGLPGTAQSCRFFTREFYRKVRVLTGESGIFSFTLPFSENFLSPDEQRLKDLFHTTLRTVFRHVFVFPGTGYTFVASDREIRWPVKLSVETGYLEPYTLASMTKKRLADANTRMDSTTINSLEKPVALYITQKQWLGLFGTPILYGGIFIGLIALIALLASPKTVSAFSVGTTGFVTGIYSVSLLIIYQFCHGILYAKLAVLMIGLVAGFVIGSMVRKFPYSDGVIGIYACMTLMILTMLPNPSTELFFILHAGVGFLSAAQFVSRKGTSWSGLYAADLAGGVIGMAICSTVLVPHIGIFAAAIGIGALKIIVELFVRADFKRKSISIKSV